MDEIQDTKKIFTDLDENNDGKLSREELIHAYRKIYGEMAESEVDNIMALADIDGSGEIDYSEWIMATTNRKSLLNEEKLKQAFAYFDEDGSGQISVKELEDILGVKKRLVEKEVWNALI